MGLMVQERFLNETGVSFLVGRLLEEMDVAVNAAIVTTIDGQATNETIPGTLAVYNFVRSLVGSVTGASFAVVPDGQPLPATSDSNRFYLWRSQAANPWGVYLHFNGTWHFLAELDMRLDDFWSKAELVPLTNAQILAIVSAARG